MANVRRNAETAVDVAVAVADFHTRHGFQPETEQGQRNFVYFRDAVMDRDEARCLNHLDRLLEKTDASLAAGNWGGRNSETQALCERIWRMLVAYGLRSGKYAPYCPPPPAQDFEWRQE